MYGPAFKIARQYRRKTSFDFAAEIGFSHSWISQMETQSKAPSLACLDAYASYLGVRLSSFIAFAEALHDADYPLERMCDKMRVIYDWAKAS